jgi:hypothetical protein
MTTDAKRWLPVVGLLVGLASAVAGSLLYPSRDAEGYRCGVHVVYRDLINGTGEMADACPEGTFALGAGLVLIALGIAALIAGSMFLLTRYAARITTRLPAQAVAGLLLLTLAIVSGGGYQGWRTYTHHRDTVRLHHAEQALAALALPQEWTGPTRRSHCSSGGPARCAHSAANPTDLRADLIALVHGRDRSLCVPTPGRFPCGVDVVGEIDGYPAAAYAQPDLYFELDGPPPKGATRLQRPDNRSAVYVAGSIIQLYLLTPEE